MSGLAISRMKSHQNIINIGKGQIEEFVAETFFEDYVQKWKATGLVPKGLLQDISPTGFSLKVCMYRNYIGVYSLCRHGLIVALIKSLSLTNYWLNTAGQRGLLHWQADISSGESISMAASHSFIRI